MSTTFNSLDLIFLVFAGIFVLTAFFRGFVKEVFSGFNWILAIILSHLITPYVTELINGNKMIVDMITRTVVFIVLLVILSMTTSSLRKTLQDKIPYIFDRSLGVLFGIVKTLVIFGVLYSLFINGYGMILGKPLKESSSRFPSWLREAKCRDVIKFSAEVVNPAIETFIGAISQNFDGMVPGNKTYKGKSKLDNKIDEVIDDNDIPNSGAFNKLLEQMPEGVDAGYSKKDIEKMNRLIEIIE